MSCYPFPYQDKMTHPFASDPDLQHNIQYNNYVYHDAKDFLYSLRLRTQLNILAQRLFHPEMLLIHQIVECIYLYCRLHMSGSHHETNSPCAHNAQISPQFLLLMRYCDQQVDTNIFQLLYNFPF